jgi:hypothetical protein
VPPMPRDLPLQRVWKELDYRIDICRVTEGGYIEHLSVRTETWCVSPSVDMLPFGVTIPATVPQRSAILEGLMCYPVYYLQTVVIRAELKATCRLAFTFGS